MYLYRAMNLEYKNNPCYENGQLNEGQNLWYQQILSPSYAYVRPVFYDNGSNSFPFEKNLAKFFYPSLLEALAWISENRYQEENLEGNYVILEINLPEEVIHNYLGIGNYAFITGNRLEYRIPYEILYQFLAMDYHESVRQVINLINQNNNQKLNINTYLKRITIPSNLYTLGTNELYPYLCFKINNLAQIYLVKGKYFNDLEDYISKMAWQRTNNYKYLINDINIKKINYDVLNNLTMVAFPFLEKENQDLKRVLTPWQKTT